MHEQILHWLRLQPGWERTTLDSLESTGLFPLGLQILQRKEDILGGERQRIRAEYKLLAQGYDAPPPMPSMQNIPVFGEKQQSQLRLGHLTRTAPDGLHRWEIKLRIEYTSNGQLTMDN